MLAARRMMINHADLVRWVLATDAGSGILLSSSDLTSWVDSGGTFQVPGGGQYLAATADVITAVNADDGLLYWSTDAHTWTLGTFDGGSPNVRRCGSRFVAYGNWTDGAGAPRLIATSTDGMTWTNRTTPVDATGTITDVAGVGSTLVAVGNDSGAPLILRSTDGGVTWATGTFTSTAIGRKLTDDDEHFTASIGQWSATGGPWLGAGFSVSPTGAPAPPSTGNTAGVTVAFPGFDPGTAATFAISGYSARTLTSSVHTGGWVYVDSAVPLQAVLTLTTFLTGTLSTTVSLTAGTWNLVDLTTIHDWTTIRLDVEPVSSAQSIAEGDSIYLADWFSDATVTPDSLLCVATDGATWRAGCAMIGGPLLASSTDGLNFTYGTVTTPEDGDLTFPSGSPSKSVQYLAANTAAGRWVAWLNDSMTHMTSSGGSSWASHTHPFSSVPTSPVYAAGLWVVACSDFDDGTAVMFSTDQGVTWQPVTDPLLTYMDGYCVAATA